VAKLAMQKYNKEPGKVEEDEVQEKEEEERERM
jgi:hypothetical protein